MPEMTNQELNVVVMPNGSLQLEWADTQDTINKSSRLLADEIYERFETDSDSWLLFLGFCDHQVPLSPSLDFWRNIAGEFAKKLCRTPDLEVLRHKVDISLEEDALKRHLECAPLVAGSEYLTPELIENVWKRLHNAFCLSIKSYKGTVENFIRDYSPNVHLVGRVFFHLVESKSDDYPFAFMATYSTRLNRQGKSKHLPLKHALQEYGGDSEKLLELLTTVH
ncbi:MAG: ATP-dependent helicase, partial [Deltaproteobacteria bacterium]|nr:ATP-dependent helicase [Deltaproteobacteria bacterium]